MSREYESRRRDVAVLQGELIAQHRIANEKALHCQELNEQLNETTNKYYFFYDYVIHLVNTNDRKYQLEKELLDQNMKLQRSRQQFIKYFMHFTCKVK